MQPVRRSLRACSRPCKRRHCRRRASLPAGTVYFESKGEPLQGQLSVAEVVLNRSRSGRFPLDLRSRQAARPIFFIRGGGFPNRHVDARLAQGGAIARIAMDDLADGPAPRASSSTRPVSPAARPNRVARWGIIFLSVRWGLGLGMGTGDWDWMGMTSGGGFEPATSPSPLPPFPFILRCGNGQPPIPTLYPASPTRPCWPRTWRAGDPHVLQPGIFALCEVLYNGGAPT